MTILSTAFTRRKILEKQVAYLRDVEKNDREYIGSIEALLEKGKRSDGTALTEEDYRYQRRQLTDIRVEMSELAGVKVVEPGLTFDQSLTLHLGNREVRILFLGKGNTAGDAVIHVPDSKVVVTGDLLVHPVPYGYGCHPGEWVETLKKLMAVDATVIVPGHGPVLRDWHYAKQVIALLEAIRSQVGEAVRQGATLEETRKRVNLDDFRRTFAGDDYDRDKAFRDFFVLSAVERAWQEAKGNLAEE
jgi:glyoxylase-like metal-dependent hydrolase (beta-lactamase superfamily II)